jgi:hypothetical protein
MAKDTTQLAAFIAWTSTLTAIELSAYLADACWKDQLDGTDIMRDFLLQARGIDLAQPLEDTNVTGDG